jgi:hypothetical protein
MLTLACLFTLKSTKGFVGTANPIPKRKQRPVIAIKFFVVVIVADASTSQRNPVRYGERKVVSIIKDIR